MANTTGDWSIAAIQNYIDETSFELISKSILETNLAQFMNVRVGLQANNVQIPILDTDFVVQDGANCGWNPTGNTSVTTTDMILKNNKVNVVQCAQTLRDTFFSQSLASGALRGGESLPFEALLADHFVKKLNSYNESYIISGEAAGGYSGLTHYLTTANGTVSAGTATNWASITTAGGVVAKANALYSSLSGASILADDLVLICSPESHRALMLDIVRSNYYHIAPNEDVYIPGTNVKVIATSGLSGSNVKYIGPASKLFLGTDLTSDFEQFKLWYSEDNDEVRGLMRWRLGVSVSEPNQFAGEGIS